METEIDTLKRGKQWGVEISLSLVDLGDWRLETNQAGYRVLTHPPSSFRGKNDRPNWSSDDWPVTDPYPILSYPILSYPLILSLKEIYIFPTENILKEVVVNFLYHKASTSMHHASPHHHASYTDDEHTRMLLLACYNILAATLLSYN